jgi:heat-inducible transcriptional repressor
MQYPSLTRSSVRHVELVPIASTRLLLVLITDTGRVEQRVLETSGQVTEDTLADLRARLNAAVVGRGFPEVPSRVADIARGFGADERPFVSAAIGALLEALVERPEERVVLGGTANIVRFGHDFVPSMQPLLEALEEQVVLLRLLGELSSPSGLTVRIGHENEHTGLTAASVVATSYGPEGESIAKLGVLGPTRMDYAGTIAAVRAVARYVGQILAGS